ncbi:MAG: PSD1 domain-containing protein [Planctomycetales bacterium]|nr:PSD1 domain-containing protein [Planctomycetales bacterium]
MLALTFTGVARAEPVDFGRDVQPLLADRCFHCHGPDAKHREAELRLDVREAALAARAEGLPAVTPGKPEESALLARVSSADAELRMPPEDSGRKPLTSAEVALLRRWIESGAEWDRHWSFEPPRRPPLPADVTARHPIDAFIRNQLRTHGLAPAEPADKRTLIRRVTLDLIGLPPTVDEVEAFVADDSPDAYEKLVDRLLESPHYGERMAWPWLDAARYADTGGYQGDPDRTMWPWRDWVVRAMNDNMPFDQFTVEQLAGDLLPDATLEQRLATGFNRNHMHNAEGGRIAEETRVENVFDRVETTGTVWLGLTLQCARCHDHKFDPTSNEDYFGFFDFFNQTSEGGGTDRSTAVPPSLGYVPLEQRNRLESLDRRLAEARQRLLAPAAETDQRQAKWEGDWLQQWRSRPRRWQPLRFSAARSSGGAKVEQRDDLAVHVTGNRPEKDSYELTARTFGTISQLRLEALVDPQSPGKSVGRDELGNFVLSELELSWRPASNDGGAESGEFQPLAFASAEASISQGGYVAGQAIDGKLEPNNGWAPSGHTQKEPSWAVFRLREPLRAEGDIELSLRLRFESQHTHHAMALFRVSTSESSEVRGDESAGEDASLATLLELPADRRSEQQRLQLRERFRRTQPEYAPVVAELSELQRERDAAARAAAEVRVMVMDTIGKPRPTYVLVKGLYNNVTDKQVSARVPGMLPPLAPLPPQRADSTPNRLDLARWLVSADNPLTARVTVNRLWQEIFGRGIVTTPGDFGLQGARPSHPELLDWLAVEFVESGWDVKRLLKLIVTSETYCQSARTTPELLEKDPDNALLARSPRRRLPSWMLRDQALSIGGLLERKLGGPPVRPYQPAGVWAEATFGKKQYAMDAGEKLYRRSLYTFWRRIIGPTMFFDAAKRQTCEVQPSLTNTPLHALTTLNDVGYVEAARALAARALKRPGTAEERIAWAFASATSRPPESRELSLLSRRLDEYVRRFREQPAAAEQLLAIGASPPDAALDAAEHAAFTTLCNTLLNLDETLVRP